MNEQFTRQATEMFSAAKDAKIPENFQAIAEEGVAKTREAYKQITEASKDGAKAFEEVTNTAQAGVKALSDKVLENASVNTEAALDAAEAIARADTLPEVARLQANYIQKQAAVAGAQTKELFELSTKVAKQTFETFNAAASKSFEQLKK